MLLQVLQSVVYISATAISIYRLYQFTSNNTIWL